MIVLFIILYHRVDIKFGKRREEGGKREREKKKEKGKKKSWYLIVLRELIEIMDEA